MLHCDYEHSLYDSCRITMLSQNQIYYTCLFTTFHFGAIAIKWYPPNTWVLLKHKQFKVSRARHSFY